VNERTLHIDDPASRTEATKARTTRLRGILDFAHVLDRRSVADAVIGSAQRRVAGAPGAARRRLQAGTGVVVRLPRAAAWQWRHARPFGIRRPLGMRVHFVAAMVVLALASVGLAGVTIRRGVGAELTAFQDGQLQTSAASTATAAAWGYRAAHGWSDGWVAKLIATERLEGYDIALLGRDGRPVAGSPAPAPTGAHAPIQLDGEQIGTLVMTRSAGPSGQAAEQARHDLAAELGARLDRRLLGAGLVAGLLALLLACLVAFRLARPLHRLTDVARRMAHGEIETRAVGSGGPRETTELAVTLDRLAAALRRQDVLRRATAHDVVHELRGTLVGVVGRIEALQDGIVVDERGTLDRMARDARRLNRLVDDVLLLAEAQKPSLLVHKTTVDLDEICAERAAGYAERFADGDIAFSWRTAPARVEGDRERLGQIVDNLLSNALRYTDPGGRVAIRMEVRDGEAVVRVRDTGIGIAPEHLARIFDRFWRDPQARERVAEGSGVGLALVRDLVLAHEGRVEAESRPGEGSAFSVFLPLAARSAPGEPLVRDTSRGCEDPDAGGPMAWRLVGEIDTANAPGIQADLIAAVGRGPADLVLDLTEVSFMDSAGAGCLVAVAAEVGTRSGHLTVVGGPPQVRRLFDLLELGELVDVADTRGHEGPGGRPHAEHSRL
jgi:two-component system, OmpR family, sensor histidine kinase BaeS